MDLSLDILKILLIVFVSFICFWCHGQIIREKTNKRAIKKGFIEYNNKIYWVLTFDQEQNDEILNNRMFKNADSD